MDENKQKANRIGHLKNSMLIGILGLDIWSGRLKMLYY